MNKRRNNKKDKGGAFFKNRLYNGIVFIIIATGFALVIPGFLQREVGDLMNIDNRTWYATQFDVMWYPLIASILSLIFYIVGGINVYRHINTRK